MFLLRLWQEWRESPQNQVTVTFKVTVTFVAHAGNKLNMDVVIRALETTWN